jgi:carboxymethylenebutenolidase
MVVTTETVDVKNAETHADAHTRHRAACRGRYPAILVYSDIFQITGAQRRLSTRLAGYGFVVATPRANHRVEPPARPSSSTMPDVRAPRKMLVRPRSQNSTPTAAWRSIGFQPIPARARPDWRDGLLHRWSSRVSAAMQPDVRGTVCFYPTVCTMESSAKQDAGRSLAPRRSKESSCSSSALPTRTSPRARARRSPKP